MRILAASIMAVSTVISAEAKVERPPQFVLLAFDGSRNLDFWKESRRFARENKVRFTYFISGVYFLARKDRKLYREPQRGRGRSAIGYGGHAADISRRVEQVALAVSEGHEIASHANGHFNGARYSASQWKSEFDQFETIMAQSWTRYSDLGEPDWWQNLFLKEMKGARAPELGRGPGLYKALKKKGYAYDTSRTARTGYWPEKLNGVWNFPLANLRMAGSRRGTLSMDYNFYVADSGARRGPSSQHKRFEERMFKTYMNYFRHNYSGKGNRAPIDIGHHFSAWNGGAYWRAMKRFTREVCGKPEVICGTYTELVKFVEDNKLQLKDFQNGNFDRSQTPSKLVMAYSTPAKPTKTYKRQAPLVLASLAETPRITSGYVPVPKQADRQPVAPTLIVASKDVHAVKGFKPELNASRPKLHTMSAAERKAYWTLVWYKNNGKTMPADEAKSLGILPTEPAIIATGNAPSPLPKLAKVVQKASVAVTTAKVKVEETNTKPSPVATKPQSVTPELQKEIATIFDAGLRRPDLSALNAAERKAYWTKVWYARRDQRKTKKSAGS